MLCPSSFLLVARHRLATLACHLLHAIQMLCHCLHALQPQHHISRDMRGKAWNREIIGLIHPTLLLPILPVSQIHFFLFFLKGGVAVGYVFDKSTSTLFISGECLSTLSIFWNTLMLSFNIMLYAELSMWNYNAAGFPHITKVLGTDVMICYKKKVSRKRGRVVLFGTYLQSTFRGLHI